MPSILFVCSAFQTTRSHYLDQPNCGVTKGTDTSSQAGGSTPSQLCTLTPDRPIKALSAIPPTAVWEQQKNLSTALNPTAFASTQKSKPR